MTIDVRKKLNRYLYAFNKIDFEGILEGMDERITANAIAAGGEMPDQSIGTDEIEDGAVTIDKVDAGVSTSLGLADSALQSIAEDSIGTTELAGSVETSLGLADSALQSIAEDSIGTTELAGSVETSLGLADSALQTQSANVADASVIVDVNATFDDTEVEAAINANGTKINEILAALQAAGLMA